MWNIGWGITNECNMKCSFCYSKKEREMSTEISEFETYTKFIDENFNLVSSVNYGTGENTLSSNWLKIISYVNMRFPHVIQGLTTNGFLGELYKKDKASRNAILSCLNEIDVSLDFGNKEQHNMFRGSSNAFDFAISTLGLCVEYGKKTTIVFIGTNETLNIKNIKSLFKIAEKYNAVLRLNLYRPTNGINEYSKKFIPDFTVIKDALIYINNNYKILSLSDPLFSSVFTHGESIKDDPSGMYSIRILPDGYITPSTYLITKEFKAESIKTKNVLTKLNDEGFLNIVNRELPKECTNCKYSLSCKGGTFDRRYLWNNNFTSKDPYCPFKNGEIEYIEKLSITPDNSFQSIHDGYLPTMFFRN